MSPEKQATTQSEVKPAQSEVKPTPAPAPTPTEPVKLDLKDQMLPAAAFTPLAEEIKEVDKDKLIDRLIEYINDLDFPPRFKDALHAYAYFEIRNDATITRLNKLAEEMKKAAEKQAPIDTSTPKAA